MIALTYDVRKYRRCLAKTLQAGDTVIEIGPHTGASTVSYIKSAKLAVVVDKASQSKFFFKRLRSDYDNLRFVQGDARSFTTIRKVLKHIQSVDVIAVDMGGGRYPDTVFKVWATWSGIFKPRDSVIRDRGLIEFVRRSKIADDSLPKSFEEDGWLSTFGRGTPYKLKKQLDEFRFYVTINKSLD